MTRYSKPSFTALPYLNRRPLHLLYRRRKKVNDPPGAWLVGTPSFWLGLSLFLLFSLHCPRNTRAQTFSDSSRISLLTCAPGAELFSKFGHSALRINDPLTGRDVVFNYGLFDFNTPYFYPKFIRGKLKYMLGVQDTRDFIYIYAREGRKVEEQVLQLNTAQRRRIIQYLLENYRPENRYYLYDFFYDNCATRIRDILEEEFATELIPRQPDPSGKTFRQLLDEYIGPFPWADFGIDIILGLPADRVAGFRNEMFLPDYLSAHFAEASFQGKRLTPFPTLVEPPRIDYLEPSGYPSPLLVFGVLLVLMLLQTWRGTPKVGMAADTLFFGVAGLAGLLLIFMWLGTDHRATWYNMNLLWAQPLWLFAIGSIYSVSWSTWPLRISVVLVGIALLGFPFWPQEFHPALLPIFVIFLLRGTRLWRAQLGSSGRTARHDAAARISV